MVTPARAMVSSPCSLSSTAPTETSTLSLHDALPILQIVHPEKSYEALEEMVGHAEAVLQALELPYRVVLQLQCLDRKSTRLNSSHVKISYAVFCLKKKNDLLRNTAVCTSSKSNQRDC